MFHLMETPEAERETDYLTVGLGLSGNLEADRICGWGKEVWSDLPSLLPVRNCELVHEKN